ncbi:MAG: hypothetical protein ACXWC9_09095 [Pseudobdellovibrionaceae bacterium]
MKKRIIVFAVSLVCWFPISTFSKTKPKEKRKAAGILLPGSSGKPAASALKDYEAKLLPEDLIIDVDPVSGKQTYRTQYKACLRKGATIGQVNAALRASKSRIVRIFDGDPCLTLMVPPGASPTGNAFEVIVQITEVQPM